MRQIRGLRNAGCLLCAMLLMCGWLAGQARADAVAGEESTLRHPDGTEVRIRVWGDEFYRVVESMDGYTLVRDPLSGVGCYARLSADGNELVSTGVPAAATKPADLELVRRLRISRESAHAKIAAARARYDKQREEVLASTRGAGGLRAAPCTGNVQGITLIVDFSDDPWTIPASSIDNYCNQVGYSGYGNNGSVRDYFYAVSDGNLTYTNYVPPSYYRAAHPKSWYEDPNYSRARDLVLEALNDLDNQGFDFSQYDSNGDGVIDAINVFYAGYCNNNWAEGLWPHSGWISFSRDGVSSNRYQITDMSTSLELRTFCHENGHMICYWPDLYDYGYESNGVGNFCLMCYGASNTNPCEPCAYMKYQAGWTNTISLTTGQTGLSVTAGVNTIYRYLRPGSTTEYYMVENRQKSGRDASIPDHGVAIWHVDQNGSNDYEQMTPQYHYLVTLVQADGDWDLENNSNYGDSGDLWAAPSRPACTPDTNPDTSWWSGAESGAYFRDISTSAATMTFTFSFVGLDCNDNDIEDACDVDCGAPGCSPPYCGGSADCNENDVPDECESQADCQPNGTVDICEIFDCPPGTLECQDCNHNNVPDECDLGGGASQDCNNNDIPDECDISGATSVDCQSNNVPDECEFAANDCNENAVPDECDILRGTSADCQDNDVPDECEMAGNDCNANVVLDECDIATGYSRDCNLTDIPDECELAGNDCNANGNPDECDADCNSNAIPDECDVAAGTSADCNNNGVADECDGAACYNVWGGFPRNTAPVPFQPGQLLDGMDYIPQPGGDGSGWDNPSETATVEGYGCQTGDEHDLLLNVTVPAGIVPETGYVVSENFQPGIGGQLAADGQMYAFSCRIQLIRSSSPYGEYSPKTDWLFIIEDARSGEDVFQMEFVSSASTRTDGVVAGHLNVKNAPGSPQKYIDTGVELDPWMWTCHEVEVLLDNVRDTVKLFVEGELKATIQLGPAYRRMDRLRIQAELSAGTASDGLDTRLRIDAVGLCVIGGAAVDPAEFDCNDNGVLDECDITEGTSIDCDTDGVPDGCLIYGDTNSDGDVDLSDYPQFRDCMAGPAQAVAPACEDYYLDQDCDGDIDLADFAAFQAALSGSQP